jgi:hypothetical protein
LFHAFTNKPVSTARLQIQMDLLSDIFIERQKALIDHRDEQSFHTVTRHLETSWLRVLLVASGGHGAPTVGILQ